MSRCIVGTADNCWTIAGLATNAINALSVPLIVAGAFLIVASFFRLTQPHWERFRLGFGLVLVGAAGFSWQLDQPPASVGTDTITPDSAPAPNIVSTVTERLHMPWDSEDRQAKWSVCETLALLSDVSYRSPVEAKEEVIRLGFSGIMPLVDNSMVGYVVWHDDDAVIVFRGTNPSEISDWEVNINENTFRISKGGIHEGFWLAYQSLKPQMLRVLQSIRPKHLWITGHSLGGAMALACAIDLTTNENMAFDGLVTFGQPKVAEDDLAAFVDEDLVGRYARVVIGDDAVARIPPSKAFCGSLVWFTSGGLQRSPPLRRTFGASEGDAAGRGDGVELTPLTTTEWSDWKNANRGAVEGLGPMPDEPPSYQGNSPYIKDHDMAGYLSRIRKHLGIEP